MKKLAVIPVIIGMFLLIGCGAEEKSDEAAALAQHTETITLEGVQCQMCVANVQQAAAGVEGVEGMRIDFDQRVATVSFNPDYTTLEDIEKAIARAGYTANETHRDEAAYEQLPDCCK